MNPWPVISKKLHTKTIPLAASPPPVSCLFTLSGCRFYKYCTSSPNHLCPLPLTQLSAGRDPVRCHCAGAEARVCSLKNVLVLPLRIQLSLTYLVFSPPHPPLLDFSQAIGGR